MAIMRTYAIYHSSRRILALLCTVTLAVSIYGVHSILTEKHTSYSQFDLPFYGCLLPARKGMGPGLAQAWIGHLCFDFMVFTLALYKSLVSKRSGFSILSVMLRDGTIYFGIMVLSSISVILSFYLFPGYLQGTTATLTNVLSSTMISRLMLNLRDPQLDSKNDTTPAHMRPVLSQLVFGGGEREEVSGGTVDVWEEELIYSVTPSPIASFNTQIPGHVV
ncbi:hypothetical protein CPB84DRAFT_1850082 [Gymnopilus junonius]|uniref:Uncharacterized protein n=1 Tax=Gymnopilus junonius TaxID=109634 RepID=A0A9P5TJ07_GYMJU|nr:hypothetical protein CPB84DRAFT_1850082 [Gymnopilus junonius]